MTLEESLQQEFNEETAELADVIANRTKQHRTTLY
jgi:hypothetical protein